MAKYGNRKVTVDGIRFDSKKEAARWRELLVLKRAGLISDLERQVKYELIPVQRVDGKCVERAVNYIADFVYRDENGDLVVEDVKGYRDPHSAGYAKFVLKRKLMLYVHGIAVREI
ncbi:MAG: DUF1064 domain-containing protein [Clostridia bacterium]|nr:DUF1064 domain-containing protein [Clostridia bacterium]